MLRFDTRWELHGEFLGRGKAEEYYKHGTRMTPWSTAFVCPQCGNLWARINVHRQRFFPEKRICDRCGPGFILPYDIQHYPVIPRRALQHEIIRLSLIDNPQRYDSILIAQGL